MRALQEGRAGEIAARGPAGVAGSAKRRSAKKGRKQETDDDDDSDTEGESDEDSSETDTDTDSDDD